MYAQVTRLQCWKSEHTDQTCEDALGLNLSHGLLTVADGVGTTLFSNIWARHLVEHFLDTPLLSDDPFEVEWWLRTAQQHFQQTLPALEGMPWNVLQKVQNEGSFSTLATVRIAASSTNPLLAQAKLLVFGDSCIFLRKAGSGTILSFPLDQAAAFDQPPICLPSKLSAFNRHFQRAAALALEVAPGDILLLATDAVARWIVSAGNAGYADQCAAFMAIVAQTPASWPIFIAGCRASEAMVDDDCTAVVLHLGAEAEAGWTELGSTVVHRAEVRAWRKHAFLQAVQNQNKELAALFFGDGADLEMEGIVFPEEQRQQARAVADALREVLSVLRREVNGPLALQKVTPIWLKHASLLLDEPCAASVCKTLARLGVMLHDGFSSGAARQDLRVFVKSQEQLELERRLRQALSLDRDEAIAEMYYVIHNTVYETQITCSLPEQQRIQRALQNVEIQQRLRRALASQRLDQMAIAADLVARDLSLLTVEEQQIMLLACRFVDAWRAQDDDALLDAVAAVADSPYQNTLSFSDQEKAAIEYALQQREARREQENQQWFQEKLLPVQEPPPSTGKIPPVSEWWFRKVSHVKRAYLLHWVYQRASLEESEQMALDDLVNAPLIQEGISLANRTGATVPLLPEMLLPDIFQAFIQDPLTNYSELRQQQELTDGQIKDILLMFLNRQLFEEYLLWEQSTKLEDWLQVVHGCDGQEFQLRVELTSPWVKTLRWWKG